MSEMRWFRAWTDMLDDPKLLLLSPDDRWYFIAICALKRTGILDEPDSVEVRDRKVALKLRLDHRERDEIRRRLVEVRLIDENWQPHGWPGRQFGSDFDSTASERQRRHRLKKSNGSVARDISVTVTRDCHGSVTRPETDTESEKNQDMSASPTAPIPELALEKTGESPIERLFEHWRTEYKHFKAVLDPKRRRLLAQALKSYDEATLKEAISGYKLSPHHMGKNEQRTVYDDLGLLLRDAEHIERGLGFARAGAAERRFQP